MTDGAGVTGGSSTGLRVRLLQTNPILGEVERNLTELDDLARRGRAADLVVAPELATHGYHLGLLTDSRPIPASDPRVAALGRHGSTIVVGMAEQAGDGVYNSAAVISSDDVRVQRKLYLPTYRQWEEAKNFVPGDTLEQQAVAGARTAVLICNDMWQPVVPWLAAHAGAEILVVPTNSAVSDLGRPTSQIWDTILRHAALTLQTYVVFVNRVGDEGGDRFWGGSRVVAPTGDVLGELGDEVGETTVELDLGALRELRRQWPLLDDTRPDLVRSALTTLLPDGR